MFRLRCNKVTCASKLSAKHQVPRLAKGTDTADNLAVLGMTQHPDYNMPERRRRLQLPKCFGDYSDESIRRMRLRIQQAFTPSRVRFLELRSKVMRLQRTFVRGEDGNSRATEDSRQMSAANGTASRVARLHCSLCRANGSVYHFVCAVQVAVSDINGIPTPQSALPLRSSPALFIHTTLISEPQRRLTCPFMSESQQGESLLP